MKRIEAVLIGAGLRGAGVYCAYALEHMDEMKVVAVAEPDGERRANFAREHNIPAENQFSSYEELLGREKMADCALVCTQDRMHFEPVMMALQAGYHVLCEKPMSVKRQEILAMGEAAKKYDRILSICHVLRYSAFFEKLKELLDTGRIGTLMSVIHQENVGYWHQAHSFVRGNWRDSEETSPMILQKCCHDMDILLWLTGSHCRAVSSFGSLSYFKEENAPEGAPLYCMDGCAHEESCPFYAPRFYLEHERARIDGLCRAVSEDTSEDGLLKALKKGLYGRCVFRCGNNVVDHQSVSLEFENQVTVSFNMCAFTNECERVIQLMGTEGQITGNMDTGAITLTTFRTGETEKIHLNTPTALHSGSDSRMMEDFVRLVASDGKLGSRSAADMSVESHMMALAAEEARVTGKVVMMEEFGSAARDSH